MTFNFQSMVAQHQTGMHFDAFGEPLTIHTSAGETIETSAIIKVTEQAEANENGIGVIVRAELAIPDTVDRGGNSGIRDDIGIRSTWTLEFRGQRFGIEALAPPVAGFIKVQAVALSRELTRPAVLDPR